MRAIVATVVVLLLSSRAEAQSWDFWRDLTWAADLDLSARYATNADDWVEDAAAERLHQTAGNIELRGLGGKGWFTLALAIDVEVGFEVPGAFVYGFHFSPLGAGVRFGERGYLGVLGGIGFGGVTSRAPFALEMPLDAFFAVDLGDTVRLEAFVRANFLPGCEARQEDAMTLGFADEAEARLGIAFGALERNYGAIWSDGTYVGLFAREQDDGRVFGLMIGVSGNGSSTRGSGRSW